MPSRVMWLSASTVAWMPTTAFILSSATVVAGLLRSTFSRIPGGNTSASTLSPTLSAVVGSTLFSTTSCRRSVSVQNCSLPKVSKRKMRWPSATRSEDACSVVGERRKAPRLQSMRRARKSGRPGAFFAPFTVDTHIVLLFLAGANQVGSRMLLVERATANTEFSSF